MGNKVFLYRTKEADDRDCCAYIDIADLEKMRICCDRKFNIYGACYSASLGGRYANLSYSEIETYLTEEQYNSCLIRSLMMTIRILSRLYRVPKLRIFMRK